MPLLGAVTWSRAQADDLGCRALCSPTRPHCLMQSRKRKREKGKARGRAEGRGRRVLVAGVGPRRGFGERGLRRHEGQARVEALGDGTEQGKGGGSMVLLLATAWHRAERRSGKGKGHAGDRFRHGEARGRESRSEEGESRGERGGSRAA